MQWTHRAASFGPPLLAVALGAHRLHAPRILRVCHRLLRLAVRLLPRSRRSSAARRLRWRSRSSPCFRLTGRTGRCRRTSASTTCSCTRRSPFSGPTSSGSSTTTSRSCFDPDGGSTTTRRPFASSSRSPSSLAIQARGRVGFHAWAALATLGLMTLNYAEFGYAFSRPFTCCRCSRRRFSPASSSGTAGSRRVALALVATLALYVQRGVHRRSPRARVWRSGTRRSSAGSATRRPRSRARREQPAPRHDRIAACASSPKTPFGAHFEPLLPDATGRRFYAGFWDGWQWSSFRQNLLAAGAIWGRSLEEVPPERGRARSSAKWGIRDAFVWSPAAQRFFAACRSSTSSGNLRTGSTSSGGTPILAPVVTTTGSGTLGRDRSPRRTRRASRRAAGAT